MYLINNISIHSLIDKFDVVFGIVLSAETLLEDVYNAAQNVDEKVVIWDCRLESHVGKNS